jgi:hypothetical protein
MRALFLVAGASLLVTTSAAAQPRCTADATGVVNHIYTHVLERRADPESLGLIDALGSGRATVREVVGALASSEEHQQRFFWPPVVVALYDHMLQRQPTRQELIAASTQLAAGAPPAALVADLAARAANNEPQGVRMLYRRLLQRDPDPEGLRAYTELAQRSGPASVAQAIIASPEYRERATAQGLPAGVNLFEQPVRMLYRHILGRDADSAGVVPMAQLASVYGARGVVDRLLNSREYLERFGHNGIPGSEVEFCAPGPRGVPREPGPTRRPPRTAIER